MREMQILFVTVAVTAVLWQLFRELAELKRLSASRNAILETSAEHLAAIRSLLNRDDEYVRRLSSDDDEPELGSEMDAE